MDEQFIAEPRRAPVVDLGAHYDGKSLRARHFAETHPELLREMRAGNFDEAQIDDIVDDAGAVGVEEHHLHGRFDARDLEGRRWGI